MFSLLRINCQGQCQKFCRNYSNNNYIPVSYCYAFLQSLKLQITTVQKKVAIPFHFDSVPLMIVWGIYIPSNIISYLSSSYSTFNTILVKTALFLLYRHSIGLSRSFINKRNTNRSDNTVTPYSLPVSIECNFFITRYKQIEH